MKRGKQQITMYILSILLCIFAGLYFRGIGGLGSYLYTVLWASVWYFVLAMFIRGKQSTLLMIALSVCIILELTQLYSAPWINELRATEVGGWLLGSVFRWEDLVGSVLGCALSWMVDTWIYKR